MRYNFYFIKYSFRKIRYKKEYCSLFFQILYWNSNRKKGAPSRLRYFNTFAPDFLVLMEIIIMLGFTQIIIRLIIFISHA